MNLFTHKLIPDNIKGKPTDIEDFITLTSKEEAIETFKRAGKRVLNVNIWHKLSGFLSAVFLLRDEEGNEANRLAQKSDYIQIDIPGPGPAAGGGYDWVKIEAIEKQADANTDEENFGMRVRSCKNPNKAGDDIAHFFTGEATSSFIIRRKDNIVFSSYHGRNEVPNTGTDKLKDNIRNTIVGGGAMIGISELQWSRLIKSFLEEEV